MPATLTLPRADAPAERAAPPGVNRFHLNLNVADIDAAVRFYAALFGHGPFKHYPDYAEFVVDEPMLVLALSKYPRVPGGPINHIGLRFTDLDRLEALHARLEAAGLAPTRQGTVNCCYSTGTKVWAVDPDHNLLELYVLQNDLPQFGYEEPPAVPEESTGLTWEHRSPTEPPDRIPHADGTLDAVELVGTFNAGHSDDRLSALLAEAKRALKPGGKLVVQGMVGDKPFPGLPNFPGLASRVKSVPVEHEPADLVAAAGFVGGHYVTHGDIKCIQADGVQLRKVRLVASSPRADGGSGYAVRYLGPFAEAEFEGGRVFRRGESVEVPVGVWQQLKQGPAAAQFAFFADDPA